VNAAFVDAARLFAPQKGADEGQVAQLTERLRTQAGHYRERFGVDVTTLPGSGAAGGLAGGLAALGARIAPGFDVVAEQLRLADRIAGADLVVTGEGRLDRTSLLGKAPVGVARLAAAHGVPCLLLAGDVAADLEARSIGDGIAGGALEVVSLTDRFGAEAARSLTLRCARIAVRVGLG
jgi:glycerate kinase